MITNYHSHTNYCDGSNPPEDYIIKAIENKLFAYGFSSHAPLPFDCAWCMKKENLDGYINTIKEIKEKFKKDIQVYCGLEVDYIPGVAGPNSTLISSLGLDYIVGSVHFVDQMEDGSKWEIDNTAEVFEKGLKEIFGNDIQLALKRYFELICQMALEETPDIIGHLDKIKMHNTQKHFYNEEAYWYKKEVFGVLEIIKESDSILEVNTRGFYKGKSVDFYPSHWILEEIRRLKIPITLSSDAHQPEEIVSGFPGALKALSEIGFKEKMILDKGEWICIELL